MSHIMIPTMRHALYAASFAFHGPVVSAAEVPGMIYGTAWKKERTKELVRLAIDEGFRAFDTANQPKHYNESLLGEALKEVWSGGFQNGLRREQFWIQTKFSPSGCEDQPAELHPYNDSVAVQTQVQQSFSNSLSHLGVDYVDSLLMHAPYPDSAKTMAAWKEMENIYKSGKAKLIGVSNFNLVQLRSLVRDSIIPPSVVQNRCLQKTGWDKDVREFCDAHGIRYQGFWLLTGNRVLASHEATSSIAARLGKTTQQIIFKYVSQSMNIIPLTGTKDTAHMRQDLEVAQNDFELTIAELEQMAAIEQPKYTNQDPVEVSFHNDADSDVELFWKNVDSGELLRQGGMATQGKVNIKTFHSHNFLAKIKDKVVLNWRADRENGANQIVRVDYGLQVEFQNTALHDTLTIYWVSSQGREVLNGVLQPSDVLSVNTYVGHTFLVKDKAGEVVSRWNAEALTPGKQIVKLPSLKLEL